MTAYLVKRISLSISRFGGLAMAILAAGHLCAQSPLQAVPLQDLTDPQIEAAQPDPSVQRQFAEPQPLDQQPADAQPDPPVTAPPISDPPVTTPQVAPQPAAVPDPGASLPPELQSVPPQDFGDFSSSFGATAGSFSAAPTMMGDFFGGGFGAFSGVQTVTYELRGPGFIVAGNPGAANSTLAFEFGNDIVPDDILTTGLGQDISGDGNADTFNILEPVPPTDAPISPGPGFNFAGGNAVYVEPNPGATVPQDGIYQDGDTWFVRYSYVANVGGQPTEGFIPVPAPGVSVRRMKLSENFSPEVRNRCFFNYNFFNDAYAGLGDVSRYVLGVERIVLPRLVSLELRLPTAGTYGSTQVLGPRRSRDFELGDPAVVGKAVLLRRPKFIWTGGFGVTMPLADNTKLQTATGTDLLVVENQAVHMLPFTSVLFRPNCNSAFQAYVQMDVPTGGNPIYGNLNAGVLPRIGVFNDSTLLQADVAFNRTLYRNRCSDCIREVMFNAELHYTGTVQESDLVESEGLRFTNLQPSFNIVNATIGSHLVLPGNLIVSPAIAIPLRGGLDRQFDYEGIVQLNYIR